MSRDLRAYYEAELATLRELGAEFARAHPESAHLLSGTSTDPSVERLLQGVAFLTGRMRKRMEEDLAEVAYPIVRQLWPGWLRPIPAITLQAFASRTADGAVVRVPKGTRVRSAPVRLDDVTPALPCEFVTSWDVVLPALRIADARVTGTGRHGALVLTLAPPVGKTFADLAKDPVDVLRLAVHDADLPFAASVVRHLAHPGDEGDVLLEVGPSRRSLPRPRAVGFDPEQAVLDTDLGEVAQGSRLLRELFAFPQKLLFVELVGLGVLPTLGAHDKATLTIPFARPFADRHRLRAEHFVPGCTPAVNAFERAAHPFSRLPLRPEHRLLASGRPHEALEVLDVLELTGQRQGERQRTTYQPLASLLGRPDLDALPWFDVRLRADVRRRTTSTWIVLSDAMRPDQDERFSATILCGNGQLPQQLRPGDVAEASGVAAGVSTRNLLAPTPSWTPPVGTSLVWALLGQLAAAETAWRDVAGLRAAVGLHNFRVSSGDARDTEVHRRRMTALRGLSAHAVDRLVPVRALLGEGRTAPPAARVACRGTELHLVVDGPGLDGEGIAWLFGAVLERALADSTTLNTFTRLVVREAGRAFEDLAWPARFGERSLA